MKRSAATSATASTTAAATTAAAASIAVASATDASDERDDSVFPFPKTVFNTMLAKAKETIPMLSKMIEVLEPTEEFQLSLKSHCTSTLESGEMLEQVHTNYVLLGPAGLGKSRLINIMATGDVEKNTPLPHQEHNHAYPLPVASGGKAITNVITRLRNVTQPKHGFTVNVVCHNYNDAARYVSIQMHTKPTEAQIQLSIDLLKKSSLLKDGYPLSELLVVLEKLAKIIIDDPFLHCQVKYIEVSGNFPGLGDADVSLFDIMVSFKWVSTFFYWGCIYLFYFYFFAFSFF